jgi:hypothetical protein
VRKTDAAALKERAAFQNAGATVAAQALGGRLLPCVGDERAAVQGAGGSGDAVLQVQQVGADDLGIHAIRRGRSKGRVRPSHTVVTIVAGAKLGQVGDHPG